MKNMFTVFSLVLVLSACSNLENLPEYVPQQQCIDECNDVDVSLMDSDVHEDDPSDTENFVDTDTSPDIEAVNDVDISLMDSDVHEDDPDIENFVDTDTSPDVEVIDDVDVSLMDSDVHEDDPDIENFIDTDSSQDDEAIEDADVESDCDCIDVEVVDVTNDIDVDQDVETEVEADVTPDAVPECDETHPCFGDFICDLNTLACMPACQIHDEICDGLDNNCNSEIDEGVTFTVYPDLDDDGRGNDTSSGTVVCEVLPHTSLTRDDCDDNNPLRFSRNPEVCDDIDNDCNGQIDNGVPTHTFYRDRDADGFGLTNDLVITCHNELFGYSLVDGDCLDSSAFAYPGGKEVEIDLSQGSPAFINRCNDTLDNDCDGLADALDYDCGDRDGDGVVNGVDPIYTIDTNMNGVLDTVCVVADMVMPAPWSQQNAIRQGVGFGTFERVNDSYEVSLENGAWCLTLTQTNDGRRFRYISVLNTDQTGLPIGNDCTTWVLSELQAYCSIFSVQDRFCHDEDYTRGSACDLDGFPHWVIGACHYASSTPIVGCN